LDMGRSSHAAPVMSAFNKRYTNIQQSV
jgi:hypothetical protein